MLGLLLGGYVVTGQFVVGTYPPRLFITAHVHLLLVGFMLMLVMGVATWMFPRPAGEDRRYRPELAETVYWVMADAFERQDRQQGVREKRSAPPIEVHGLELTLRSDGFGARQTCLGRFRLTRAPPEDREFSTLATHRAARGVALPMH